MYSKINGVRGLGDMDWGALLTQVVDNAPKVISAIKPGVVQNLMQQPMQTLFPSTTKTGASIRTWLLIGAGTLLLGAGVLYVIKRRRSRR